MISRQFAMFLLAGGIAAAVNFGSRILLSQWFPYVPAIVLAYCLGMTTAFVLNKVLVFQQAENALKRQLVWFAIVNLAAIVQTILISLLVARWILPVIGINSHNETFGHAVGITIPVITSYLGHKHLSFSSSRTH